MFTFLSKKIRLVSLTREAQFDSQWRKLLLQTSAAVVGLAALVDYPLLLAMRPELPYYVLVSSLTVMALSIVIILLSSREHVFAAAITLGGSIMAYIAFTAPSEVLLYQSIGAAFVIPILVVGIVTNIQTSSLFGAISILILFFNSFISGLPWNSYTFTSVFIICITVGLLWLLQSLIAVVHKRNVQLIEYAAKTDYLTGDRLRIANNIHDDIGHVLMTINMQIEAARAHFDLDPDVARQRLDIAQRYTKEAAAEVRYSIAGLRMPIPESATLTETVATIAAIARTETLDIRIALRGTPRRLSPQITFALTRIIQEAITNVRKHAQATCATITLDYSAAHQIRVVVQDNGIGVTLSSAGYGLLGIQERTVALAGRVTTETAAERGFTLRIEIPT